MNFAPNSCVVSPLTGDIYNFVESLGEGASGSVYRVVCNGYVFALKIISLDNPSAENEIRVNGILTQSLSEEEKQFVSLYQGFFFLEEKAYILYPLLSSPDIYVSYLKENRSFSLKQVQAFLRCVGKALVGFKRLGIVHADIKPENVIMIAMNIFHLIDYGNCVPTDTYDYKEIYTRFYRPPEAIFHLSVTPASDIWALACTAVEMLDVNPLFPAYNNRDLVLIISRVIGPIPEEIVEASPVSSEIYDSSYRSPFSYVTEPIDTILGRFGDADFLDLIKKMLALDQRERITVDNMLVHPFLTKMLH